MHAYWHHLIDKHGKLSLTGCATEASHLAHTDTADLRPSIVLSTTFLGSCWSELTHSHTITLQHAGGKPFELEAEFLISATGPLSTPNLPNIPGLDKFEGTSFHCYKWNSSTQLKGKRIGVIGNGSSGVQMVVSHRG